MAIDFKTFLKAVPYVIHSRKPVMLRGRHGVGKSELVYQMASQLGLPVVERRCSQMTEGDLLGMPSPESVEVNGHLASHFRPFSWFLRSCTEATVLFLDEVDRSTHEVGQSIMELTDSRKLAGWTLHPGTIIIAAVNGGEHGSQYQVNEMDPAQLDRFVVFDVEPSIEDWLEWGNEASETQLSSESAGWVLVNSTEERETKAGKGVHGLVWDFINQNRAHLEHSDDYEPNKVYPSRRSWKRLNDCLVNGSLLEENADQTVFFTLSQAHCGLEAAVSLLDFFKAYDRQVTWEQVVNEGQVDKTKNFDINEHAAMVEKIDAAGALSEDMSAAQLDNLAEYFKLLPAEIAMKLWSAVGKHAASSKDNIVGFHARVREVIIPLLGGTEE